MPATPTACPFVARGAGTGLSGGALPVAGGVVISVARMRRILEIDLDGGRVVVEPGVANLEVTRAVAPHGYFYAPDPSSQQVCTIGGNVAENSGGAHCLKHGFTVNHVCGLSVVLSDGELVELGGKGLDEPGPDLIGAFVGSEGTLGIAVRITLRIVRRPEQITTFLASFDSTDEAGGAVSDIVAAGILPGRDRDDGPPDDRGGRGRRARGLPRGRRGDPDHRARRRDASRWRRTCGSSRTSAAGTAAARSGSPTTMRSGRSSGRGGRPPSPRSAASAPTTTSRTGSCPRTQLPAVLRQIQQLSVEHGLRVGNVFHAGDGNLHPLVLYDGAVEGEADRAELCARAILDACVDGGRLDHR